MLSVCDSFYYIYIFFPCILHNRFLKIAIVPPCLHPFFFSCIRRERKQQEKEIARNNISCFVFRFVINFYLLPYFLFYILFFLSFLPLNIHLSLSPTYIYLFISLVYLWLICVSGLPMLYTYYSCYFCFLYIYIHHSLPLPSSLPTYICFAV